VRDKLQRESSFLLWTTAPRFRGDEFTPAKDPALREHKTGAGVTLLVFVFCNRYYFALYFIGTQRGALKTCLEVLLKRVAPSNPGLSLSKACLGVVLAEL